MPCKDTTSHVKVCLSQEDHLTDFEFSKFTCQKEIGGGTGFREYCLGRHVDEIVGLEFEPLIEALGLENPEDQFFLYLEWDAVGTALAQYLGWGDSIDLERYKIASIIHDEDGIQINQAILPPEEMPKSIPCCVKSRKAEATRSIP